MKKNIVMFSLILIIVAAAAFFAGTKYQQRRRPSFSRQFGPGQTDRVGLQNRSGFRPVNGEIISADEKSITVKMQDSTSRIVLLSDKTEINKASSGTKEDLKVGETVAVFGTENTDGSVTAQNIQLNPLKRELTGTPSP